MKTFRQLLAAPFVLLSLVVLSVSIAVDLIGVAVVFVSALIAGSQ